MLAVVRSYWRDDFHGTAVVEHRQWGALNESKEVARSGQEMNEKLVSLQFLSFLCGLIKAISVMCNRSQES